MPPLRIRISLPGLLALLFGLAGLAAVALTYGVFTQTYDEPASIATGMELLDTGRYTYELQHPPLARLATALGPWLAGAHSHGVPGFFPEGNAILYESGPYQRTLTLARLGILPFFAAMLAVAFFWGRRLGGPAAGALAVGFAASAPSLLAHAGLATTDLATAAGCFAALYALVRWQEAPRPVRGLLLGIAVGAAIMAKFSAIPFLGASLIALVLWRWARDGARVAMADVIGSRRWAGWGLGALGLLAVCWAAYGFSLETPQAILGGIAEVQSHNDAGHRAFLLGEISNTGWWYYFHVALLFKTPLPFLLLAIIGGARQVRRAWVGREWQAAAPVLFFSAILTVAAAARIDIGIRHVLLLYPLTALMAAEAALWLAGLARRAVLRAGIAAALLLSAALTGFASHPDYLAYFNVLAGDAPERILNDSNLDWGQDLGRLATAVQQRGIDRLGLEYFGSADPAQHGLPPFQRLWPGDRASGWVAVSLFDRSLYPAETAWLDGLEPVALIGRTILLYDVPADRVTRPALPEPPGSP